MDFVKSGRFWRIVVWREKVVRKASCVEILVGGMAMVAGFFRGLIKSLGSVGGRGGRRKNGAPVQARKK
jgi:hypothetical protein